MQHRDNNNSSDQSQLLEPKHQVLGRSYRTRIKELSFLNDKEFQLNHDLVKSAEHGTYEEVKAIFDEAELRGIKLDLTGYISKNEPGRCAIHFAAYRGDKRMVKLLFEKGTPINTADNKGYNALIMAAASDKNGAEAVIKYLIKKGANLNEQITAGGSKGMTALHVTLRDKKDTMSRMLLNNEKCISSLPDANGNTALHQAALSNRLDLITLLVERYEGNALTDTNNGGKTALEIAERNGNKAFADGLVQAIKENENREKSSSKKQVEKEAEPKKYSGKGKEKEEYGRTLEDYKAMFPTTGNNNSHIMNQIMVAVSNKQVEKELINGKFSSTALSQTNKSNQNPLHYLAIYGGPELTASLLDKAEELKLLGLKEVTDDYGKTPMDYAGMRNNPDLQAMFRS